MRQSYAKIECIIVDDATNDDSIVKCKRLISDYDGPIQFRILHHDKNKGLSAARNTGTEAAKGDFIFYLDSDDELTVDCIAKLVAVAHRYPQAQMVIGDIEEIWYDGKGSKRLLYERLPEHIQTNQSIALCFFHRNFPGFAWNKLIKHSFIEEHQLYFKEGVVFEDILWMFFVLKYLSDVCFVKDVTHRYHRRHGSIMLRPGGVALGLSMSIIHDEIIHNLTPGREKLELAYYVEGFSFFYMKYHKIIMSYDTLMKEYKKKAKELNSMTAYLKLCLVKKLGKKHSGIHTLQRLKSARQVLMRLGMMQVKKL